MERDINNAEYLEWGEFNENLYGTKLDSIKQVIQSGRMCVIDCAVKSLKLITNQEFMPYIVFIKSPSSIDDLYNMKLKAKNSTKLNKHVGVFLIRCVRSTAFKQFSNSGLAVAINKVSWINLEWALAVSIYTKQPECS